MGRQIIQTNRAPQASGPYSQAVRAGDTVYLSGQIPLDPETMQLVTGDIEAEIRRVFENLKAVAGAAGGARAGAGGGGGGRAGRARGGGGGGGGGTGGAGPGPARAAGGGA